jgi:hypothetical protein
MIINEHTNSDGEAFYSTRDNDGEMIYSSTEDFEVTWDQATEDAAQAEREAWAKAEAAEAAEAARTAEAREEAREAEARAIRAHGTRVAAEAEARAAAWASEAAEAPEFWIIDLDHPAESRGEFPASGPYPTQAAAEKYIISDTKAIWADSSPFSSQRFCQPLKIVKVVRTVQPEVTAMVALVDSH